MRRRLKKKDVDRHLLETIFSLEREWKQIQSMVENSIEPVFESRQRLMVAQAKYMFLLREAKKRKVSALRY